MIKMVINCLFRAGITLSGKEITKISKNYRGWFSSIILNR